MPLRLEGGRVLLIDQRLLPDKVEYFDATGLEEMCFAIKEMVVRGAPSIGVAAAFGMASEAQRLALAGADAASVKVQMQQACEKLQATRPTAVNLRWATDKIFAALYSRDSLPDAATSAKMALDCAEKMLLEHIEINKRLSDFGATCLAKDDAVLTHCNAGPLAVCGWGTALGVIRSAAARGLKPHVFVDETRPGAIRVPSLPFGNCIRITFPTR